MKQSCNLIFLFFCFNYCHAQEQLKIGETIPNYIFTTVFNTPKKIITVNALQGKPTIFAFWGTSCAPCIPEIKNLGILQKQFDDKVNIVAVSDDSNARLKNFIDKNPNNIIFASDSTNIFWERFIDPVMGYAALVDADMKLLTVVSMEKINSDVFSHLIKGDNLNLKENRPKSTRSIFESPDFLGIDSSALYAFIIAPKIENIGNASSIKNNSARFLNMNATLMYSVIYEIPTSRIYYARSLDSIKGNDEEFCAHLIAPKSDYDSIREILKKELKSHFLLQATIEKRLVRCNILQPIKNKGLAITKSAVKTNNINASQLRFEGRGVKMRSFVSYLGNSFRLPIFDDTGLKDNYDIVFEKNNLGGIEERNSIDTSLLKLGLELVKGEKEMEVLIISSR